MGVAAADSERRAAAYRAWISAGLHGEMAYLADPNLVDARESCEAIAAGARSVICVALAYDHREPAVPDDELRGRIARYARGEDYHHVVKKRLSSLASALSRQVGEAFAARCVTDTAPLLERALGERAGVGFVGKNTMLISPGLGSYTVLGELLTTADIAATERPSLAGRCGDCRACLDACPTHAFPAPFVLDATRCISYLTIEHRGSIPSGLRSAIGDMVLGCDICQDVCPYNTAAPARHTPEPRLCAADIEASRPRLSMLAGLRSSGWKRFAKGRAVARATRRGMIRNAAVALGNSGDPRAIKPLSELLAADQEIVVEHAAWALRAIATSAIERSSAGEARARARDYRASDWPAICEVHDLARILELDHSGLLEAFLTLEMTAAPEGLWDGALRVATIGETVVGFVVSTAASGDDAAEITWLYVHPSWHRRGVGRALLADALSRFAGEAVEISVLAENRPAVSLYESVGFEIALKQSGSLQGNERFPANGLTLRRNPTKS